MNGKELSVALRSGRKVFGTLIVSTSPVWAKYIGKIGLDFVFIDTEHVAIDRATLSWMCRTYRAMGLAPVVRIPSPDPYQATVALDDGACGVIAPYVESAAQVRALRGAVKLRPLRGEKLCRILAGEEELETKLAGYVEQYNSENVLIINIESQPAIKNLDEILSVPQLDAVLIGPHDLSCSLGVPEDYSHSLFLEATETIIRQARAKSIGVGSHFTGNINQEIEWARNGANLIVHSSDIFTFIDTMRSDIKQMREQLDLENQEGVI